MAKEIAVNLITVVLKMLSPEVLMKVADRLLDAIEDAVKDSENKIDDMLVLPLCGKVREAFQIEDND